MIAAAAATVPELWERLGSGVSWVNHEGEISDTSADVYASWRPEKPRKPPVVILCVSHGPFSLDVNFPAHQARELAAQLVRGAELAEATQVALDAERVQEQNPCCSK